MIFDIFGWIGLNVNISAASVLTLLQITDVDAALKSMGGTAPGPLICWRAANGEDHHWVPEPSALGRETSSSPVSKESHVGPEVWCGHRALPAAPHLGHLSCAPLPPQDRGTQVGWNMRVWEPVRIPGLWWRPGGDISPPLNNTKCPLGDNDPNVVMLDVSKALDTVKQDSI